MPATLTIARFAPRCTRPLFISTLLILAGCASEPFEVSDLAKSDIDLVADAYVLEQEELLQSLMIKLYKRNPGELRKAEGETVASRIRELFGESADNAFAELGEKSSIEAITLAFDEQYQNDRVFALMAGLTSMIRRSWNDQREFFIMDSLDEQKLYDSARNIEATSWRLRSRIQDNGQPYLLAHGSGKDVNFEFARIFAKLTAHQDMMATLVAQKHNRTINRVIHGVATMAFVPI